MMQGRKETLPTPVDCQVVSDAISLVLIFCFFLDATSANSCVDCVGP